jgi:hypothetical protein
MIEAICFFVGCFVGAALVVAGFIVNQQSTKMDGYGYQPIQRKCSPPPREE